MRGARLSQNATSLGNRVKLLGYCEVEVNMKDTRSVFPFFFENRIMMKRSLSNGVLCVHVWRDTEPEPIYVVLGQLHCNDKHSTTLLGLERLMVTRLAMRSRSAAGSRR